MKIQFGFLALFLISATLMQAGINQFSGNVTGVTSEPYNADAMWVEPSSVTFSTVNASVGSKFNITIWLNITSDDVFGYQVALHYNHTQLQAVRAAFTKGNATSQFLEDHDTVTGGPVIDTGFLGNGSVLAFESCEYDDYIPAPQVGSLIYIEFEIIAEPSQNETLTSLFDITTAYPADIFVQNPDLDDISITTYDGTYTYVSRPQAYWDVVLTATLEGYTDISKFGVRSDATENFDPAYDEINPPAPPVGVVSYFWHPDNPSSPVDLRKLSVSKIPPSPPIAWTYKVRPVNIDGILCISWSSGDVATVPPEYGIYLQCPDGSMINMRDVAEYCFPAESCTTYEFTIFVGGCYFELPLLAGWNMVSFPCLPIDDPSFSNILSDVGYYQVLTWDGSDYVPATIAEAGKGYWIEVLEDTTVQITNCIPIESYELDLPAGWSMIGSIFNCTVDADLVFPSYYQLVTWDGKSYVSTIIIEPGKGYWIFVLEETHIIVDDSFCTPG